jgi:DNA-binding NarL/FixJ family response regulator
MKFVAEAGPVGRRRGQWSLAMAPDSPNIPGSQDELDHMDAAARIKVLIAEDQQLVRRAFAGMLSLESDIEIVAQAADGAEAIQLARQWRPNIVLMDLQMPRVGGIGAIKRILEDLPDTRIIVLTTFDTDELVFEAISAGAHAYLLKDSTESDILETIRAVHGGQSRLSPRVAGKILDEFRRQRPSEVATPDAEAPPDEPLTEREEKVLAQLAKGKSNREIADTVFLAEGTVKNYVSKIMEKLHVQSRTELAIKALRRRTL